MAFAQEAKAPENPETVLLAVNNQPITRGMLEMVRRSNPIFNLRLDGAVGQDLENLLVDQVVFLEAASQDAVGLEVTDAELAGALTEFRKSQWLERDETYQRWQTQTGWTDESLRASLRQRLQIGKRIQAVQSEVRTQPAELEAYFLGNRERLAQAGFLEDRVLARMIVVNDLEVVKRVQEAIKRGDDFAALAQKFSLAGAARGGAVSADGSDAPKPVTRKAFPGAVASAVFKLSGGKVTPAIRDGANVYFVKVIRTLPGCEQPWAMQPPQLRTQLGLEVLGLKQRQALEGWLDRVRSVNVQTVAGANFEYFNPVVGSVGDTEIRLADVNRIVYFDPQVSKVLLGGVKGSSGLVPQFFKTKALQTLLDEATAAHLGKSLKPTPIGPRSRVLEVLVQQATKSVRVTSGEAQDHYWDHIRELIVPANAVLIEASFKSKEAAEVFRAAILRAKGKDFAALAGKNGGSVRDLGYSQSDQFDPALADVFSFDQTTKISRSARLSRMYEQAGAFKVYLVQSLTLSRTPRFREVRDLVTRRALEDKRNQVARAWLDAKWKQLGGSNRLNDVNAELEARAKAQAAPPIPTEPAPTEPVPVEPAPPPPAPSEPPSEPAK